MDILKQRLEALSPAKRRLIELRREKGKSVQSAITRVPRGQELPLSFAQQRQWLLNQFAPNSSAYNAPEVLRLRGMLDSQVLERALNEIVRRHEVLRTTYVFSNNQPVQVIRPELQIPLSITDLSHLATAERGSAARDVAQRETQRPLDLANGPVLRTLLVRLAPDDHLLVVTFHHIAYDGWSKTIFNRELAAIYDALVTSSPCPLADLPVQYADYASWQRKSMQGEVLKSHLEFWRTELDGAPGSIALPTDFARPHTTNLQGGHDEIVLGRDVLEALKSVSKQEGATLFATLLSVLNILLGCWAGQQDLVVGTVVAHRDHVETEDLLGCFINFLPLRCKIGLRATAGELLDHVRGSVLRAYAHQECPFEKIVDELRPQRAATATPLYNVVFVFQNYPPIAFASRTLTAEAVAVTREAAHMDLRIDAGETAEGLQIACDYRSDLFSPETIRQFLTCYGRFAEKFVSNPKAPLSDFQVSSELQAQASQARARSDQKSIVVASTFTADTVEESLRFWMKELDVACDVRFTPFNQVFQGLLDPQSELSRNQSGLNVVLVRFEDWCANSHDVNSVRTTVERNADELMRALRASAGQSRVPYLLCLCPASKEMLAEPSNRKLFRDTEERIAEVLRAESTIHVVTSAELAELYPVADYDDRHAFEIGRIPYTQDFFTALGTIIARRFYRIHTPPHKVVVLDCDNVLWRGICGEDGATGVVVDAACVRLQEFVLQQRRAGMVIALCSKNNEADVWSVFDQNPGMLLKREHIAAFRINWNAKSENLRLLSGELGLALDSFIFLDDSPMECAEVESGCPDVLALQVPDNEAELNSLLLHVWAFDHLKATSEDRLRGDFYAQNVDRENLEKASATLEEFLASLELQVDIRPMEAADVARVAQLSQRTNQFNFTGIRRTEPEISRVCEDGAECVVVRVRDRFGDYGLVGAMIFRQDKSVLALDSLFLSCRALGRRVEHQMLAYLGQVAGSRGRSHVQLRFKPTPKNQPAREFLDSVNASLEQCGEFLCWQAPTQGLEALDVVKNEIKTF